MKFEKFILPLYLAGQAKKLYNRLTQEEFLLLLLSEVTRVWIFFKFPFTSPVTLFGRRREFGAGIAWWKFSLSKTGLNLDFSFCKTGSHTKVKDLSLSYLATGRGRIDGFIFFSRLLVLCEMHISFFKIWTRIAEFTFYDDNRYTTNTSIFNRYFLMF